MGVLLWLRRLALIIRPAAAGCQRPGGLLTDYETTPPAAPAVWGMRLQLLDLDLAPLDGAAGVALGRAIAELQRDRPLRELAVVQGGRLGAVQHDGQLRAFGGDLIGVPLAAGLGHGRYRGVMDDAAGAVGGVGTLVEDVRLVAGLCGALWGVWARPG